MITSVKKFSVFLLIILVQFIFISPQKAFAATAPDLGAAGSYSVLSAQTVTNTGATTMPGDLGVNPGSAVVGFPPGSVGPPGTIHTGDTNAAAAQISNFAAFDFLDQGCTTTYAGIKDLVGENLVPGVYCADAFTLTGTLTLSGSGVWIFKSASTLITSGTANVVGGDPCNVWWREVSSATLGTGTSLIGNILAHVSISLATGATLNGRALAQIGAVTLQSNTITGAICLAPLAPTPTPTPTPEVTPTPAPTSEVTPTPAPTSEVTPTPTSQVTGAVLGVTTLAPTGSGNSKLGVMLMLLGAGITLTSLYAFKKKVI